MRYQIKISETAAKVIRKLPQDEIKRAVFGACRN